ncbi:MAG: SRPBCC domain-containing protein [Candidatus Sulfotelmatobacter sp.]
MATATILPGENTIVAEIFIAAPPERVFKAITDPAQLSQWWGQKGMYRITERTAEVRPSGKWSSVGVGADGTKFRVDGEYLQVEPPRLLVHTWIASWTGDLKTVVRWELEPSGDRGTLLKIRHQGFAAAPEAAQNHGEGWKRVLGWLLGFAEKGETVDTRD